MREQANKIYSSSLPLLLSFACNKHFEWYSGRQGKYVYQTSNWYDMSWNELHNKEFIITIDKKQIFLKPTYSSKRKLRLWKYARTTLLTILSGFNISRLNFFFVNLHAKENGMVSLSSLYLWCLFECTKPTRPFLYP